MAEKNTLSLSVPEFAVEVAQTLHSAGFEVYLVGGCVRGLIMGREVADWDFTTNATPGQIQGLFEHTVYENDFGTVGVVLDGVPDGDSEHTVVEVTPYRKEKGYSDNRRPDAVVFCDSLDEDLSRRDFTINALAYNPVTEELVDRYGGIADLHLGVIRTVGDPAERFEEDALRLMRAVRIATQLHGSVEERTLQVIQEKSDALTSVAPERIRDEFLKLIMADVPDTGIRLLLQTGLLTHIIPELLQGDGVEQSQAHRYDVLEHNIRTLAHSGVKQFRLEVRLAALLHDIGKPKTREWHEERGDWSFHAHEVVGARMVKKILQRLKFSKEVVDTVTLFVRWHMFFSDPDKVSLSGVRRMVARVGEQHIWDLIDLRMCDRIGTGRPKEQPYRLRKYVSLVEEVLREPVTPGTLVINGTMLMQGIGLKPGPKIGHVLHILLAEVLDDPEKNVVDILLARAKELLQLSEKDLAILGKKGKVRRFEEEEGQVAEIRRKYRVD
ncbi:MAG: CCA tRNA nucleotidyltransferase [Candidatus Kaiserbacteria bacterium]|nr:CCA tRNA nucleotidyltransferase [Candidatus Kaiserbacteria bacterium]